MNAATLLKIRDKVTIQPQRSTVRTVYEWLESREVGTSESDTNKPLRAGTGGSGAELHQLLGGYLREGERGGAVFVESVLRHVTDPIQRKLVAIELITEFKKAAIAAGGAIPPELLELEAAVLNG